MPKKKSKQAPVTKAPMTKRELSRWQKEKRQERLALAAVVAVINGTSTQPDQRGMQDLFPARNVVGFG